MNKQELRSLKYREVVHHPHPVFKGTCIHWRVNGELIEYKQSNLFRLPLKYGYHVYSEINSHNVETFHREADCPFSQLPRSKRSFFTPEQAQILTSPVKQQVLPFSEADKKKKGINLP